MMTETSNSGNEPESNLPNNQPNSGSPRGPKWRRRILFWGGGLLGVSLSGGLFYGWYFAQHKLAPLIETELSDLLNRPVKMGSLQRLSPVGARFGASQILATSTDPAKVAIATVDVSFNPFVLLTTGDLQLDVTAIEPKIYLEQGKNRKWLLTPFDKSKTPKKDGFRVNLKTLRLQEAEVIIAARSLAGKLQNPVKVLISSGQADLLDRGETIEFDLSGKPAKGGDLEVSGVGIPDTEAINLIVRAKEVQASDVGNLLPLPFYLPAGRVGGNLDIRIRPDRIAQVYGVASIDDVTARIPVLTQPFAKSDGQLRFQGTEIQLEDVSSLFGTIPGVINGIIDLEKGYQLTAKTQPIKIQQVIQALKLKNPPIALLGEVKADIQVTGELKQPKVSLDAVTTQQSRIDRVDFRPGSTANIQIIGSDLSVTRFQAIPTVGGRLTGRGKIEFEEKETQERDAGRRERRGERETRGRGDESRRKGEETTRLSTKTDYQFNLQATNVPAQAIARLYQTTIPVEIGLVSGGAQFFGTLENLDKSKATGSANFRLGGGSVRASNFRYANGKWQGIVQTSGVSVASLTPTAPTQVGRGRVESNLTVFGTLDSFKLDAIRAKGSANIAIANGLVKARDLTLANGRWVSNVQAQGLVLDRLVPNVPSGANGILNGTFNLAGRVDDVIYNLQGIGQGSLTLPKGAIAAEQIQLSQGKFRAILTPQEVALKQFSQDLRGNLAGKLNVFGTLENPNLKTIQASGELEFSEGLNAIAKPLTTVINWNGQRLGIQQATADGINASGWADIASELLGTSAAIKQFELKVAASGTDLKTFALPLPKNLAKLDYSGNLDFDGIVAGTLQSLKVDGDLALNNFRLAGLEFDPILKGTLTGTPKKGIKLDLAGIEDEIELALDPKYQPVSFEIALNRMNLSGIRRNDVLQMEADNLQIGLVKEVAKGTGILLSRNILVQPISGELSGDFAYNLKTSELLGQEVAIAHPILGRLSGDRATGNFRYLNGNFILSKALFQKNESQYFLDGSLINTKQGTQLQAKASVSKGQIQDVLEALQIFELSDLSRGLKEPTYAKAADLYEGRGQMADGRWQEFLSSPTPRVTASPRLSLSPSLSLPASPSLRVPASPPPRVPTPPLFSVGTIKSPVQDRLRRFSEIETLLRMQRKQRQEASPLPELAELKGTFDGNLTVSAIPQTGIKADFDFEGKAWQWREYAFDRIDLQGNLQNNIVTLEPLRIQSGASLFAFVGNIGGKTQAGQLQLKNIPLELLTEFIDLPPTVNFGGLLNGNVALAGSRDNPQAKGALAIAKATVNQTELSTTQGSFDYYSGRLNFQASSKLSSQAEPLTLQGSIPYQLPFATTKPASDRLELNLNVKNEGLALLDILSRDSLSWIGGSGEIALNISGRFDRAKGRPSQLRAEGIANFNNATIGAQVIPDAPLTNINGKILFNFDRIEVANLTGQFSGGKVAVAGTLPLIQATPQQNPLTVNLDNLALNLKGLYQGGVQGEIAIAGSALEPDLGGKLKLFNGRVLLGEENGENTNNSDENNEFGVNSTEFDNLKITLEDNIQLVRPPILNFLATGSLTLNGSLNQPRPQGKITLKSGQVNLFASQFRLDTGEKNTAQFSPKRGLDPYLNVQLRTSATETNRNAVRTSPSSSEIIDPFTANLDSLQTVRIRARVEGYASQLTNSIELTSIPPRSQREIITLLGGGFVNTLGRGDTTLGLANLAGSAVFGSLQGAISDTLGLSEFRVFSTPLIDEEERISKYQIGIAAEAGIDITKDISFSVLKILNSDRPPQFGLQYRVDDNFVIRGSTNFSDDNRAIIEYEQRF